MVMPTFFSPCGVDVVGDDDDDENGRRTPKKRIFRNKLTNLPKDRAYFLISNAMPVLTSDIESANNEGPMLRTVKLCGAGSAPVAMLSNFGATLTHLFVHDRHGVQSRQHCSPV